MKLKYFLLPTAVLLLSGLGAGCIAAVITESHPAFDGRITTVEGQPIPNAKITAEFNILPPYRTISDQDGYFHVPSFWYVTHFFEPLDMPKSMNLMTLTFEHPEYHVRYSLFYAKYWWGRAPNPVIFSLSDQNITHKVFSQSRFEEIELSRKLKFLYNRNWSPVPLAFSDGKIRIVLSQEVARHLHETPCSSNPSPASDIFLFFPE